MSTNTPQEQPIPAELMDYLRNLIAERKKKGNGTSNIILGAKIGYQWAASKVSKKAAPGTVVEYIERMQSLAETEGVSDKDSVDEGLQLAQDAGMSQADWDKQNKKHTDQSKEVPEEINRCVCVDSIGDDAGCTHPNCDKYAHQIGRLTRSEVLQQSVTTMIYDRKKIEELEASLASLKAELKEAKSGPVL